MAGLNGTPINGSPINGASINGVKVGHAIAPYDLAQEADHLWPPATDCWPEVPVDELEVERPRLEAEIAAAKARAAAARYRAADRDAEMRAALRAELLASQETLAEMERQHEITVAMVSEVARAEVARTLAEARRQVAGHTATANSAETAPVNHAE